MALKSPDSRFQPLELPDPIIDDAEHIDWHNRLIMLVGNYGFYPTTREELTRASIIIPFLSQAGKTARHLNEILLHQRQHGIADPAAAVRSSVRAFGLYAVDARQRQERLNSLEACLGETLNPNLTLEVAEVTANQEGMIDLLQYIMLEQAARSGDEAALQGGIKPTEVGRQLRTNYDPEMYDETLASLYTEDILRQPVRLVRAKVHSAQSAHTARGNFWQERLEESYHGHMSAAPVARRILDSLVA